MAREPFSRRHGFRSPARPVAHDEIPDVARIRLRQLVDRFGRQLARSLAYGEGFPSLLLDLYNHIGQNPPQGTVPEGFHALFSACEWLDFLDICERVLELSPSDIGAEVEGAMNEVFTECGMRWRAEGRRLAWSGGTPLFAQSLQSASGQLRAGPAFAGPLQQFENAYRCLSSRPPDVANCIKDAIGAVEGVARIAEGSKEILSRLLDPMAKRLGIHPALREAIGKLYAYRGDEQGIAHGATQPLVIGIEEGELVLHWSASAIVYLLRKSTP